MLIDGTVSHGIDQPLDVVPLGILRHKIHSLQKVKEDVL